MNLMKHNQNKNILTKIAFSIILSFFIFFTPSFFKVHNSSVYALAGYFSGKVYTTDAEGNEVRLPGVRMIKRIYKEKEGVGACSGGEQTDSRRVFYADSNGNWKMTYNNGICTKISIYLNNDQSLNIKAGFSLPEGVSKFGYARASGENCGGSTCTIHSGQSREYHTFTSSRFAWIQGGSLNSASGLSCNEICGLENLQCMGIGTNREASNNNFSAYRPQSGCSTLPGDCNTEMINWSQRCSNKSADWSYCRCGGTAQPDPTATPVPTIAPSPTPVPGSCTEDTDCPSDKACISGQCDTPPCPLLLAPTCQREAFIDHVCIFVNEDDGMTCESDSGLMGTCQSGVCEVPGVTSVITPTVECMRRNQGDANCDCEIWGDDYSIWLNSQCHISPGSDQTCSDTRADFSGDGNVDDDDYLIWFANQFTTDESCIPQPTSGNPTATLEPSVTSSPSATVVPTSSEPTARPTPTPAPTWTPTPTPTTTYWMTSSTSWVGAWSECSNNNGILAYIYDSEENLEVKNTCNASRCWIMYNDRRDEGEWVWTGPSGDPGLWNPPAYTNWNSGEPNNSGNEDCAHMYTSNGKWNDTECDRSLPGVCQGIQPVD